MHVAKGLVGANSGGECGICATILYGRRLPPRNGRKQARENDKQAEERLLH